ncbi:MAG: flagellar assembly protein FliH [Spirochaetaceae bacterium]|jgi:flagellar assembly protein FliH|nr:flagellar assembly protein FliH [Spirochaetaceae bacterium]
MAKAVFRPEELVRTGSVVSLEAPYAVKAAEPQDTGAEHEEIPVYNGPTAEDLKREADDFKARWESEKESMLNSARIEAEIIVADAKKTAAEADEKFKSYLNGKKEAAQAEAESILSEARSQAEKIKADSEEKSAEAEKTAAANGFERGRKDGYESGMTEVRRLVARARIVMERLQDKRLEIIEQAEQEIIDIALLIARKVVKVISESQRQVVVENIKEALGKIKGKGKITVKVNTDDMETAGEYLDEFINLLEGSGDIRMLEDSSVDPGGCYIETDFGEVDARIAMQFAELESKILELSPLKTKRSAS